MFYALATHPLNYQINKKSKYISQQSATAAQYARGSAAQIMDSSSHSIISTLLSVCKNQSSHSSEEIAARLVIFLAFYKTRLLSLVPEILFDSSHKLNDT